MRFEQVAAFAPTTECQPSAISHNSTFAPGAAVTSRYSEGGSVNYMAYGKKPIKTTACDTHQSAPATTPSGYVPGL